MEETLPTFWHACRRRDLEAVMGQGLAPSASRSRSQAVYLASDRFTAENYSNFEPEAEWTVLEIDGSALDAGPLAPDDYELPELLDLMDGAEAEGLGIDPEAGAEALGWRQSLAVCCQARYFGRIPPEALTPHDLSFGVAAKPRP